MAEAVKKGTAAPLIGGGPANNNTPGNSNSGAMATFLKPSVAVINRKKYDKSKLADIDENLANGYIDADAVKDTDSRYALHVLLTGGEKPHSLVPDAKSVVDFDVDLMKANIKSSEFGLSADDQMRYGRAMQVFDAMKANNFQVMKGPGGVYWMESTENGKKVYASNGILEVAELLDKFSGPTNDDGTPVPSTDVVTDPKKLAPLINNDPNQELFTKSEKWHLAALSTDLLTSTAGVIGKAATIGTGGAGFLAGAAGVATSVVGGLASLGMSMYGDYLDKDVSASEMAKNAGIRLGLEAMETVSIMPLSLMNSLKGASTAGKVLRKGIHLYMLKGVVDTAVGNDWMAVMDKEDWEMDDYRKMASMAQFMIGSMGGAAANRYSTRKNLSVKTKAANQTLDSFSEGKISTKQQLQKDTKFGNIDRVTGKYKLNAARKTESEISLLNTNAGVDLAASAKLGRAEVKQGKQVNARAAAANEPVIGANGQAEMNFNATSVPPVDLKTVRTGITARNKAIKQKHEAEVNRATGDLEATTSAIDAKKAAGEPKLLARLQKNNKEKVQKDFETENIKTKKELDDAMDQATITHGSVIAGKLRARAEKRSGVSEDALAAKKAGETPAVIASQSKLESYGKEKIELEKKLKDVKQADRTPEDVAEMKRIDDAITKETKNSTGIRGVGRKIISKAKEGSAATGKGASSLISLANAVPSALTVRDGVSSRSLARSTIYGDGVDDLTGNRFYQYDMPTAKARLLEEGYSLSEINKYNLAQLRGALRTIEKRDKKQKKEAPAAESKKLISKKRPKTLEKGGSMQRFQAGGVAGFGKIKDPWAVAPTTFFQNVPKRDAASRLAAVRALVVAKAAAAKAAGYADNADTIDVMSSGHADNIDIPGLIEEKETAVSGATETDKKAVAEKFDVIIAAAKKTNANPVGTNLTQWVNLVSEFKASDLFGRNRIHIEIPIQEDLVAPVFQTVGVRNMPGYQEALNRTTLIPRIDTSDSFAANIMQREYHNDGEKRRTELVARNAGYIENARAEEIANTNRNMEAAVNANNNNIQRRNQNELNYSAQKVQAEAQYAQAEQMRKGRLTNALFSGIGKVYKAKKTQEITALYNEAASSKSKWNNEFKPRYDAAVASGDTNKVKEIKAEFIQNNLYDPDDLDKQMMEYKTQFRTLDV